MTLSRRTSLQPCAAAGMLAAMTPSQIAFYATVATIIPVLFVAIAVQGGAFRQVINAPGRIAADAAVTARRDLNQPNASWQDEILKLSPVLLKLEATRIAVWLLELAAILIVAAGAIGELLAIYALYQGHDHPGIRLTVLLSVALLTCAVIIEPVQAQVSIFREVRRRRRLRKSTTPRTETGETDTPSADQGNSGEG